MKPDKLTITRVQETCLYVTDIQKTRAFYERVLDLPVVGMDPERQVFFRAGSSMLLCFLAEVTAKDETLPPHHGSGQLHFALEVPREQYQAWKEKIEQAGISIEKEVDWFGRGLSFYFRDPDQHLVEIVMPGIWGK